MATTSTDAFDVGEPSLTLYANTENNNSAVIGSSNMAALAAATYTSLEENRRIELATKTCQCQPWASARARHACPIRTCKYVKNVQAVQQIRERSHRHIFYTQLEPTSTASAVATSASSSSSSVPHYLCLSIPQCPAAMHSDAGWVAPGGGDATGNVIWNGALFATHLLHALRRRDRETRLTGRQQPQFGGLDDTPFVSLELGCGAALLSQYLSLIGDSSSPAAATNSDDPARLDNIIYASDQNTSVWTELRDRIRVQVCDGSCPLGADDDAKQVLTPSSSASSVTLTSALQARLQRINLLPFEWGQSLSSSPALSCLLPPHRTPDLIIGSDLLYFSIAYPKLLSSIWELFENYTFAQNQENRGEIRSWMGRHARSHLPLPASAAASPASVATNSAAASAASPCSPLLFLCHKSRHAETEEDFLISLSSFAYVWQLRPEFVAHLQAQGRRTTQTQPTPQPQSQPPASITSATSAKPVDLFDLSALTSPASSTTSSSSSAAASFPDWFMDPLPLDCTDPFLRIFFAMPRMRSDDSTNMSAANNELSNQDQPAANIDAEQLSEWSMHLQEAHRSFTPAPELSSWSASAPYSVHWLLCHFPPETLMSWRPDPTFKH